MDALTLKDQIYEVRKQKIMLDFDLALLYEIEVKRLKEAVRRNRDRFPPDFMFEITWEEYQSLRSQFASLDKGRGQHPKFLPYAFTEHGVAMLAGILHSSKAIEVNITIIRAFILMRQYALSHADLSKKLRELELTFNKKFKDIHEAIQYLLMRDGQLQAQHKRKHIGFGKKETEE